jgi:hypothetical protein
MKTVARLAGHEWACLRRNVFQAWRLALRAPGVVASEFQSPPSDRFARDENPALNQNFLDETQAQGKTEIEPDSAMISGGNR